MRWSNVGTIFLRESRDQLRDRRTLFMVFVLPVLLYPLLGLGLAQLTAAFQERPRTVVVVGADALPERSRPAFLAGLPAGAAAPLARWTPGPPPLLAPGGASLNPDLFDDPAQAARLQVRAVPHEPPWTDPAALREILRSGEADAVVVVPPDLGTTFRRLDRAEIPVAYDSASERSQLTYLRVSQALQRWNERIVEARRVTQGLPPGATEPVRGAAQDVATRAEPGGSLWAKIFPFLLVLMALTGAFYPAVDLCAGEKERGTMETLLISPASRAEIVLGKFLTVMAASMATALLNLLSMGLTAAGLAAQVGAMAGRATLRPGAATILTPPSAESIGWMLLLLLPLSAFFAALCLALAVLARSMKEGQYYMTPLYMAAIPLVFYSLMPGVELNLSTSLLPITGVALLLRTLMQGDYDTARQFFLPVLVPVVICGLVSLRWAIDQFKSEGVLFREAERFDLRGWLRHLVTRKPTRPTPGMALLCFVLILVGAWFVSTAMGLSLATMASVHILAILGVPVALAFLFTSDPAGTLRLRMPQIGDLALGLVLALALFPLVCELRVWVEWLFPAPDSAAETTKALQRLIPDLPTALLVLAVLPGLSEEVACRGFLLSGFERSYRPAWSILLSALLFGFLHVFLSLVSQLFNATLLGLVLGLLAWKSRSLWPGVLFHVANNAMALAMPTAVSVGAGSRAVGALFRDPEQYLFRPGWVLAGALLASAGVLILLRRKARATRPDESEAPRSEATEVATTAAASTGAG
jgi:sodium transport system permease protein